MLAVLSPWFLALLLTSGSLSRSHLSSLVDWRLSGSRCELQAFSQAVTWWKDCTHLNQQWWCGHLLEAGVDIAMARCPARPPNDIIRH